MAVFAEQERAATLSRFQPAMHALVVRGQAVDIRSYEIASIERITSELQPQTLMLVRDGRTLLGSILDDCKRVAPADWIANDTATPVWSTLLPFERAIDATMANVGSHQVVEEIAFIAQLELRQREERLARVRASHGTLAVLAECDSSLRRVRKALNAVDAASARLESVEPMLDFASELHTSLAVRRAYAKFRARVMAGGEPSPDLLRARLRGAGTQIAKLVGWDVYPDMRVQDRLLLRELQQRMLDWLRGGAAAAPATGLRLWQDLAGCVEMFALVNRRQELVDHDARTLRTIAEQLQRTDSTPQVWEWLRTLEGLDAELDEVLATGSVDAAIVRPIVRRLTAQLGTAPASEEAPW